MSNTLTYPNYNWKALDDISKKKFDNLKEVIKAYLDMDLIETKEISEMNKEIISHNISFLILTK